MKKAGPRLSGLQLAPPTQLATFCPCSSSLTPSHCPGDLPSAPMDTTCNTSGPTGTQSAFQTKLPLMSLCSPSLSLPEAGPLSTSRIPAETKAAVPCLSPLPSTLASFLLATETLPLVCLVLRLLTPLSMALGLVCTARLSLAKECPLTPCCSLCSSEAHTCFPLITSAPDLWNRTGLWGGTQQAV